MVGKVWVVAGNGFTAYQLFGLQRLPVGGQNKLGFGFYRGGAVAQGFEGLAYQAWRAHGDVDVVAKQYATQYVSGIVVARAQALEGGVFVAKSG